MQNCQIHLNPHFKHYKADSALVFELGDLTREEISAQN